EQYVWPGNVRQLRQLVEQAFTLGDDELGPQSFAIDSAQIRAHPGGRGSGDDDVATVVVRVGSSVAEAEERLLFATLAHCAGNKQRAAQILGISIKTLYNRLNAYRHSRPTQRAGVPSVNGDAERM